MCLIACAWQTSPHFKLLLVGNRDEFHARPSAPLAPWDDDTHILGGRDLEAGGTWIGVSQRGHACVVTNVREPLRAGSFASRGLLAADFLRGSRSARESANVLLGTADTYRPFNLMLFDTNQARFVSNRPQSHAFALVPGVHGLSNATLNTPWPKTQRLIHAVQAWVTAADPEDFSELFRALADETIAADADLPDTGIGLAIERRLSPAFIRGTLYGTRASSVIAVTHAGEGIFIERRFGAEGVFAGETTLRFDHGGGKSAST